MTIYVKLAIALLLVALGAVPAWYFTSDHYEAIVMRAEKVRAEENTARAEVASKFVTLTSDQITQLEAQHDQANDVIDHILNTPAPRVRVPRIACLAAGTGAYPEASGITVSASGIDGTASASQEAFNRFEQQLESDAADFGRSLAACKVIQEWGAKLP